MKALKLGSGYILSALLPVYIFACHSAEYRSIQRSGTFYYSGSYTISYGRNRIIDDSTGIPKINVQVYNQWKLWFPSHYVLICDGANNKIFESYVDTSGVKTALSPGEYILTACPSKTPDHTNECFSLRFSTQQDESIDVVVYLPAFGID